MIRKTLTLSFAALIFSAAAYPAALLINFETVPVEPTGPSLFASAGPAQTITVPGVATFMGGVILGNETNLPAQSFGTAPNVYGTAGFGTNLASTLTLTFAPGFSDNQVSFPIFNGATITENYVVTAYNGSSVVATQTLSNLASNSAGGYAIADVTAPSITSVTIAPVALNDPNVSGWDFSIDSVALNETVQQAFTPEPGTFALFGLGLVGALVAKARKR